MATRYKHKVFDYAKAKGQNASYKQRDAGPAKLTSDKKPNSTREMISILSKIFTYIGKYKKAIIAGLIMSALSSILTMLGPGLIGKIADLMQKGLTGEIDFSEISKISFMLIIIYALANLFTFLQQFTMATITAKICKKFRSDYNKKLNNLPASYFNTHTQGDVLSCVTNDIQTLRQGLSRALPGLTESIAQFITCLIMMLITEWRLTLCVYGVVFIGILAILIIVKKSQKYFDTRQNNIGSLNGLIEEMFTGYKVIKLTRAKEIVNTKFNEGNKILYYADYVSQFLSGIMTPMMTIIGSFAIMVVIVVGSNMTINGIISFGAIAAFLMFSNYCTQPLGRISQNITSLQGVCAAAKRLFEMFETEGLSDESHKTKEISSPKGKVEFKNVVFSYPSKPEKIVINNFSACIKPGQKVAIVGETGAGKTTLINLLMRFYEINSGQILIDDIPTLELKRENIHDMFGMVLQDSWLFEGSIKENLVYNMPDITEERLIEVCKTCEIYDWIMTCPVDFDTKISESNAISAGKKQLITIARAFLQNAPMLILDEATSSVDTRTERQIQTAMDKLTKGRTSFVIAHRLSTIQNADLILVIDHGDVVESGTHEELLKLGGSYAELYNSQFEE